MKIYHYLMAAAVCAAMVMSCKKDGPAEDPKDDGGTETPVPPVTGEPEDMTFTLTPEAVSGIDGYDNAWAAGDCVSVFEGAANNKFEFTSGNEFDGSAVASGAYYVLYPYDEGAKLENNALTVEIPAEQSGKAENLLAIGYSDSEDIAMKNATGFLKFTLDEDNVTKVTIKGNNGEILAGTVSVSWNGGEPKITAGEGGSATVSVGDGETVLEKGDYYVNIIPVKAVGYTATLTYKYDDSSYTGYFDTWAPGLDQDSGVKMEYTRGASEFPMEFSEGSINMTRGEVFGLQEILNPTLVFYDDYEEFEDIKDANNADKKGWSSLGGIRMTLEYWDKTLPDVQNTESPFSGTSCIKWTLTDKWGEIYFQTWDDSDEFKRGGLDLTPYRNAHFCIEFAYKAEPGTNFFVKLAQHNSDFEYSLRVIKDISSYSTGDWEIVQVPLDEMIVHSITQEIRDWSWDRTEVIDDNFDAEGNPFQWNHVLRMLFTFNLENSTDDSMVGKTVYIDDVKIKKVIISDQTAE